MMDIWLLIGALGLIAVHESAHAVMAHRLGGRFLGVVWDLRRARVGVRLDVTGLTPAQVRWTLVAAPIAEALWIAFWVWWHPVVAPWWRMVLPIHWALNALPFGSTDGARFWATWRRPARPGGAS